MAAAGRADSFELLDRARQTRMLPIRQIKLVPANPVAMDASGQGEAKMTDSERFDECAGPKMKFRDDVVVVLSFGAKFLDAADHTAIVGAHVAPDQELDAALRLSFRHDGLQEFLR
jgi:hypothetical protein